MRPLRRLLMCNCVTVLRNICSELGEKFSWLLDLSIVRAHEKTMESVFKKWQQCGYIIFVHLHKHGERGIEHNRMVLRRSRNPSLNWWEMSYGGNIPTDTTQPFDTNEKKKKQGAHYPCSPIVLELCRWTECFICASSLSSHLRGVCRSIHWSANSGE